MSKHLRRALVLMEAARPASGYMPASDAEWQKALRAAEEFAYAMYRESGVPAKKARALAQLIHSGETGMRLLRSAFKERGNE
jgi:hypothetical protein